MKENSDGSDTNVGSIENSIEEEIEILEELRTHGYVMLLMKYEDRIKTNRKIDQALEHIVSDYKRVLKINEVLLKENEELKKYKEYYSSARQLVDNNYIHKQKIKDIIDRIDYDIKKTKETISNNSNIYTSDRKNDYQIVRLRAMNTKSLDIKNRLQKLLESEE